MWKSLGRMMVVQKPAHVLDGFFKGCGLSWDCYESMGGGGIDAVDDGSAKVVEALDKFCSLVQENVVACRYE